MFEIAHGVEYRTISGVEGKGDRIAERFQISAYPTVIIIAPDGEIIEQGIFPVESADDINNPLLEAGCSFSECTSGTGEDNWEEINVYPNPSNGLYNINIGLPGEYLITVYDILGTKIKTKQIQNNNQVKIDMRNFNPGWYFITITGEKMNKTIKLGKF